MRLKSSLVLGFLSVLGLIGLVGCGGGDDEPTATTAPVATATAAGPRPTSAPQATSVAPTATTAAATGTILDKAVPFIPAELDNIKYGGSYVYANQNSLGALDPKINSQSILNVGRWFYEKAVGWMPNPNDPYAHFEPILVESWTVSTDQKTYTFKVRKGIKWHNIAPVNGRELVAADIAFSLNRYREKDSIYLGSYLQVDSIEAPDTATVVVKLKDPSAWAINDLFPTAEYIVPPELVAESGGTLRLKAIGTGPYIVKEYVFRQGAKFTRNPDYWRKNSKGGALPYTDEIVDLFITDVATATAGFRTGQLDVPLSINIPNLIALGRSKPDVRIYSLDPQGGGITFNTRKAPWNDVRVRRALGLYFNRDKFIETQRSGTAEWIQATPIPWSLVSNEPFTLDKLGPYYKYNPAEGKKLLIEAGFADGKLQVQSPTAFAQPSHTIRTTVVQELWKKEGVEMGIVAMDFPTYSPYYYLRSHPDIGLTFQNTGDFSLNWFGQNKFSADASQNTAYINDPEVQRIVKEVKTTTDPAKLREYSRILWDFDTLGMWNLWFPAEKSYSVISPRLRNYTVRIGNTYTGGEFLPWLADAPRTAP